MKQTFILIRAKKIKMKKQCIKEIQKILKLAKKCLDKYCPKDKRIEIISIFVTAIATVFMARTSWQSVSISKNVAEMTHESIKISERLTNQDLKRTQADLRPYLIVELAPGTFGALTINRKIEHLQKNGNSELFFGPPINAHLILPFRIRNDGKVSAINIKAEYISPVGARTSFNLGDKNNIPPSSITPEIFRPSINVGSIIGNKEANDFEIGIRLTYKGLDEIDSRTYISTLRLRVTKKEADDFYDIKESNFEFGFD